MSVSPLRLISLTPVACDSSEPVREAGVTLTIGRHHENALHVSNDAAVVSSKHCRVEFVLDYEVLLGQIIDTSKNGTYVNASRIAQNVPHVLKTGDVITLGAPTEAPVKLLFVIDATSTVGGGGDASEGVIRYVQGHVHHAAADAVQAANLAQAQRSRSKIEGGASSESPRPAKRERSPSGPSNAASSSIVTDGVRAVVNQRFHDDFDLIAAEDLGHGSFGSVKRCLHRRTGTVYAVKQVNRLKLQLQGGSAAEEQIRLEAAVLLCCSHPNVVRVVAFYEEADRFSQVMELMQDGDLQSKIHDKLADAERRAARAASVPGVPSSSSAAAAAAVGGGGGVASHEEPAEARPFPEVHARQIFVQMCEGLRYIHDEACVAHRDIKPANILCNRLVTARAGKAVPISRWWFKLADGLFRNSEDVHGPAMSASDVQAGTEGQMVTVAGTDSFMAPEMVALATSGASQSVMYTLPESAESAADDDIPASEAADHDHKFAFEDSGTEAKRQRQKRRAHMTYGKEVDLFSLGVVLHIILCGKHPFSKTGGGVPAVAVCQSKQAVRTALKEAARLAKLGTMAEAVEECTLLGAEILVNDDPVVLSALENEFAVSSPQHPGEAASAASSSSSGSAGRASRWAPDLSGPEWTGISDEAKALVTALMDPDPRQRPTAEECLNHPWTKEEALKQLRSIRKRSKPFVGDIQALVDARQLQQSNPCSDTPQRPFALLAEDLFSDPTISTASASTR